MKASQLTEETAAAYQDASSNAEKYGTGTVLIRFKDGEGIVSVQSMPPVEELPSYPFTSTFADFKNKDRRPIPKEDHERLMKTLYLKSSTREIMQHIYDLEQQIGTFKRNPKPFNLPQSYVVSSDEKGELKVEASNIERKSLGETKHFGQCEHGKDRSDYCWDCGRIHGVPIMSDQANINTELSLLDELRSRAMTDLGRQKEQALAEVLKEAGAFESIVFNVERLALVVTPEGETYSIDGVPKLFVSSKIETSMLFTC